MATIKNGQVQRQEHEILTAKLDNRGGQNEQPEPRSNGARSADRRVPDARCAKEGGRGEQDRIVVEADVTVMTGKERKQHQARHRQVVTWTQ